MRLILAGLWCRTTLLATRVTVWVARPLGVLQRVRGHGWWPFARLLTVAIGVLILVPIALKLIVSIVPSGDQARFGIEDAPGVGDWLSVGNVALVFAALVTLRSLNRARERVVVEAFVDYTKSNADTKPDAKTKPDASRVSGLATLLVTELGILHQLLHSVDTEVAIPTAVGVERRGGFGRGKEAASFLAASSDGLTDALEGAVAWDANVQVGVFKLPVGAMLSLLNRLARGPRLVGSLHVAGRSGAPTLTAQLLDGPASRTWRVDAERVPPTPAKEARVYDELVRELACRMFTDLTFKSSTRWRAVAAFTEYLRLYEESSRTPRDRAWLLKKAEMKLLEAVAEDESFGLAYYNLGVIYTKLAQTAVADDRASWETADVLADAHRKPAAALAAAHTEAARASFWKATEKAPQLWQARYALAITIFSTLDRASDVDKRPALAVDKRLDADDPRRRLLEHVVCGCDQALALRPPPRSSTAVVCDLRGMAAVRLATTDRAGVGGFREGMHDHRRAAAHFLRELGRAERLARAEPDSVDDPRVERARDNATAALHNLALAYARRAMLACPPEGADDPVATRTGRIRARLDFAKADRIFRAALRVGGRGTKRSTASHFERGVTRERSGEAARHRSSRRAARPLGRAATRERTGEAARHRSSRRAARLFGRAADAYRQAAAITPTHAEYAACVARALAKRRASQANEQPALKAEVDEQAGRALRELAPTFKRAVSPLTPVALDEECDVALQTLMEAYEELASAPGVRRIKDLHDLRGTLETATSPDDVRAIKDHADNYFERDYPSTPPTPGWNFERDQIDMCLARLHAEAGEWLKAEGVLWHLIQDLEHRNDPLERERIVDFGLRADHARALRRSGDNEGALRVIAECLRSDPLNANGRREAGRIHDALGQHDEALESWKQALCLVPHDPSLHFEVARCQWQLAQDHPERRRRAAALKEAKEHLDKALVLLDGEDTVGAAWTRVWGGRVALERGRRGKGIGQLTGALDSVANPVAGMFLGELHLRAGQFDLARRAFERCDFTRCKHTPQTRPSRPLDAGWGDEFTLAKVRDQVTRGLSKARSPMLGDAVVSAPDDGYTAPRSKSGS